MANLRGNPLAFAGGVSDVFTTPYPHPVGTRARDAEGNEYVFVDFTSSVAPEMVVCITSTFTAHALASTSWGTIGVVPDFAKLGQSANTPTMPASYQWTSDNAGWVQVYGRAYIGIVGTGADGSPSDAANGPTTAHTSAAIYFGRPGTVVTPLGSPFMIAGAILGTSGTQIIRGMFISADVTIADVSGMVGTSGAVTEPTNCPSFHAVGRTAVWLNYPYLESVSQPSV